MPDSSTAARVARMKKRMAMARTKKVDAPRPQGQLMTAKRAMRSRKKMATAKSTMVACGGLRV